MGQLAESPDPGRSAQPREDRGVTGRSLVFGVFLVIAISLLANTVRYILHASFMAYDHMPMGNLILFLLSILACSALARCSAGPSSSRAASGSRSSRWGSSAASARPTG